MTRAAPTELDIRARLVEALQADRVGPSVPDGHPLGQEVLPIAPSRWYLNGFLAPEGIERGVDVSAHLARHLGAFHANSWPFGEPRPRLFYDKRALTPGPPYCSLHAKCVVVDGPRAFVSSANFTQRGQERNIEVGVLIDDPTFAGFLAGQWLGLVESGLCLEHRAP